MKPLKPGFNGKLVWQLGNYVTRDWDLDSSSKIDTKYCNNISGQISYWHIGKLMLELKLVENPNWPVYLGPLTWGQNPVNSYMAIGQF